MKVVPFTATQGFWLVSALIGLVGVGFPSLHVAGPAAFWDDIRHGWGAITITMDLLLLGIAAVAFAVIESRRLGMRMPWIWIPLALPLPGAFLIPLFFLLRERALLRRAKT